MFEKIYKKIIAGNKIQRIREFGLFGFIIILCIFIQMRNPSFLTYRNIYNMFTNMAILAILAVGMMTVLITKGIDLSIAAVLALSGMITAMTISNYPSLHPLIAILLGIGIGLICGLVNGFLVAKLSVLPIIATLGMLNVLRGLAFLVSGGSWVSAHQMPVRFRSFAMRSFLGINNLVFIAIIIYILFYYLLNHTRTGRKIYAVGSNRESARVSGIKINRILLFVYAMMGGLAGLSGVLWVSRYASAQPNLASGYELTVIAACVVGGVDIAGGVGKISGVISGVLLLGILQNALPLIGVSPFWQQAIQGFVILIGVVVSAVVKREADVTQLIRREA